MHRHLGNAHNFIARRPSASVGTGQPAAGNRIAHPILNQRTRKSNYRYTPAPGPCSIPFPDGARTYEPAGRRICATGSHNSC
jgi:hypothetical protein